MEDSQHATVIVRRRGQLELREDRLDVLLPGPDVVVTSDASGAYRATVPAWTLEALAQSSSSQLSLFVTPPAGMKVVAVTQASTLPIGPLAPNVPEWYFMLARDLGGPIDITLGAQ